MKYAIDIPNFGAFGDVHLLVELAREAEDKGWDGFFLWDHLNDPPAPNVDPWIALAAIASATKRIRIGTMVTPVARRRPWKLARQTVSLDHLSGGRVILGVGLGGMAEEEHARFGEEADDRVRARALDEGLDILAGLWSGEPFSYRGEIYEMDEATFLPRPVQEPRIPVWVAGYWPNKRPFRRAVRWDGVAPAKRPATPGAMPGLLMPDEMGEMLDFVRSERESDAPFDVAMSLFTPADPGQARDMREAYAEAGATWLLEAQFDAEALTKVIRTLTV
jgi:hypothetical protein